MCSIARLSCVGIILYHVFMGRIDTQSDTVPLKQNITLACTDQVSSDLAI